MSRKRYNFLVGVVSIHMYVLFTLAKVIYLEYVRIAERRIKKGLFMILARVIMVRLALSFTNGIPNI
jgi:hypothetical protein